MKFTKRDLIDMAYGDHDESVYEVMEKTLTDTSRWSHHYQMVFKFDGKFYSSQYSCGATECQDEHPYEYVSSDEVECVEVEPYEVTVTEYRKVS